SGAELTAWHAELHPGHADSMRSLAPAEREHGQYQVAVRFAAVHVPFIEPGERRQLTPISLQPYVGDWHAGADIYASWRDAWLRPAPSPAWTREPHAWQQLQINSPEDDLRVPFDDLVEVGRECAANGVTAIQLVGWNDGGQDRGNPSHQADPRLGGADGLRAAIKEIQELGVKVVLFTKFTWAAQTTDWYRRELRADAVKDPYG